MDSFAKKMKELKSKRGYTASELSERSGVPLGTLNKLLSGIIEEPKLSTAAAIAAALGTTVAAMMGEASDTPTADDERKLLLDYRTTDVYGKALIRQVAEMESGRAADTTENQDERNMRTSLSEQSAVITLPLYYDAVSAGPGVQLTDGSYETIDVRAGSFTEQADFALRVRGNSMEPRFKNGDIVLVHQQNTVLFGELGIFIADGAGYFKRFMGDRLHSLNPEYPDIPLRRFDDFFCCGKVVGHMKKKS